MPGTAFSLPASLRSLPGHPAVRRGLRAMLWMGGILYFVFALLLLALRYAILPQIESYRDDIERALSDAINRPVAIRQIEAHWAGLRPALTLNGFEIRDVQGRTALAFDQVETELSWHSLLHLQLRLARLEIVAPEVTLRRDKDGHLFAAGLEIRATADDGEGITEWLLDQERVIVRNATIRWEDEKRGAPPLELRHLNFQLDNDFGRHRVGLTAEPPKALAARIDIRGDFRGRDIDQFAAWKGDAYAELDYADLAGWRPWLDYPVDLPQGQGALRVWMGFAQKRLTGATADVRIANLRLRLRPDLPELDLEHLEGRLGGKRLDGGYQVELKRLAVVARDGLRVPPTDLQLTVREASANRLPEGTATANGLDLHTLASLAAHLPLDEAVRKRLAKHAPHGRLTDLRFEWQGPFEALARWKVAGRFEGLGLSALGPIPGFAGFAGRIEGDQDGGTLDLDGQRASVELPTIFADPHLEFEALTAAARWKKAASGLEVSIGKATFRNHDAAGEAAGSWRPAEGGPGEVDISAKLTRASGQSVWRYMPLTVNSAVRDWLHASITGGTASEATLKLKGDLRRFPFRDGKDGLFQVKGRFAGATLDYAKGWPVIENINGELLFEGQKMRISAGDARIYGVRLKNVRAEIGDLAAADDPLVVTGRAAGPTADFLRYIEASPVAERIDHFTEEMRAEGNGELELKLVLPLGHMQDSRIEGSYRFDGNRLTVDPDLPPIADVRGQLRFTASELQASGLRGQLFGGPASIDIRTLGEGNVQVNAAGEFTVAGLRRAYPLPVLEALSGGGRWQGTVRARKKSAEVRISSNLAGISSSLPEPFNKPATEILPLVFERKPLRAETKVGSGRAAGGDQLDLALGRVLRAQVVRRHEGEAAGIERGAIVIGGDALPALPAKGLSVVGSLPRTDVDLWRTTLGGAPAGNAASDKRDWPPTQFDLRTGELLGFGKTLSEVRLSGSYQGMTGKFDLKSRELTGSFDWNGTGPGRLTGRIGQFTLSEAATTPAAVQAKAREIVDHLPNLDITVDRLGYKNRELGAVRTVAENRDGYWNLRLEVKNEDGTLSGEGRWKPDPAAQDTQMEVRFAVKSVEKMLARFGYPDAIRRGTAQLSGKLAWNGTPFNLDYPSLNGTLELQSSAGQFNKLEPGVGRLLGVLSLQSLPRRITLDFRDVFSEGFAYDSIAGKFAVSRGLMETGDLQIQGPSAKILMKGSVNLPQETQNLHVRVQPAIGETLAVGAMLTNPVAGAVAWVAQKLLKDPLDQVFAFEYRVTGNWSDPKVEKAGQVAERKVEEKK